MRFRLLTIPAAALALTLSATPAHAQWREIGRIFDQDWGRDRQIAYDNGYREGMDHGEKAARSDRPFDLQREKDYRNADEGYRREYGNKDRYREEFRRGFAEGYHQAYERFGRRGGYYGGVYPQPAPNYPVYRDRDRDGDRDRDDGRIYGGVYNGGVYNGGAGAYGAQAAFQNGVNDGFQKGRDDAHDRHSFDPRRQKWYRSGDRNYNDHLGISRDEYRNVYRRGFEEGYNRGYSGR